MNPQNHDYFSNSTSPPQASDMFNSLQEYPQMCHNYDPNIPFVEPQAMLRMANIRTKFDRPPPSVESLDTYVDSDGEYNDDGEETSSTTSSLDAEDGSDDEDHSLALSEPESSVYDNSMSMMDEDSAWQPADDSMSGRWVSNVNDGDPGVVEDHSMAEDGDGDASMMLTDI